MAPGFIRDLGLAPHAVTLPFQRPLALAAVGSLPLRAALYNSSTAGSTTTAAALSLDAVAVIPGSCLFKKAYLNYRYHARRALYLAALASALTGPNGPFKGRALRLEAAQQDPTRPVLVIPCGVASGGPQSAEIRLAAVVQAGAFPLARLSPASNSVRAASKPASASSAAAAASEGAAADQQQPQALLQQRLPTPQYNAGVLSDALAVAHAAVLQRAAAALPGGLMSDALLLLKVGHGDGCLCFRMQGAFTRSLPSPAALYLFGSHDPWLTRPVACGVSPRLIPSPIPHPLQVWARQHGLSTAASADGLDGHLLAMVLAHLTQQGKLVSF